MYAWLAESSVAFWTLVGLKYLDSLKVSGRGSSWYQSDFSIFLAAWSNKTAEKNKEKEAYTYSIENKNTLSWNCKKKCKAKVGWLIKSTERNGKKRRKNRYWIWECFLQKIFFLLDFVLVICIRKKSFVWLTSDIEFGWRKFSIW